MLCDVQCQVCQDVYIHDVIKCTNAIEMPCTSQVSQRHPLLILTQQLITILRIDDCHCGCRPLPRLVQLCQAGQVLQAVRVLESLQQKVESSRPVLVDHRLGTRSALPERMACMIK